MQEKFGLTKENDRRNRREQTRNTICCCFSPDPETQNKSRQLYDLRGENKDGCGGFPIRTIAGLLKFRVG